MFYSHIRNGFKYFKQDEKGVAAMCKIMEDMRNEAALNNARETAERLIKKGKMPHSTYRRGLCMKNRALAYQLHHCPYISH